MQNELISVVVPIYKAEVFLRKCIQSIQSQTYKNLEIILVNDGSPDNCGTICDEIAEQDSRIIVIHKLNGGAASARNAGIDVATGSYISFIDSDDTIDIDMYERMYNRITKTGSDICISGFKMIYEKYVRIVKVPHGEKLNIVQFWELLLKEYREWHLCFMLIWNKLIRRDLLTNKISNEATAPIRFNEEFRIGEDILCSADLCSVAKNGITFVDFTPYNYVIVSNHSSLSKDNKYYEKKCVLLDYQKKAMLSILPHKSAEIEKTFKCQKCVSLAMAMHIDAVNKLKKPHLKLTISAIITILRYSSSKEEKISALILYFLPASFYRTVYRLYCGSTV